MSGWMSQLTNAAAADPKRKRHCILLWMPGGATQTDTFDMKPNHDNGGEFKEIATSVPGLRFSETAHKVPIFFRFKSVINRFFLAGTSSVNVHVGV